MYILHIGRIIDIVCHPAYRRGVNSQDFYRSLGATIASKRKAKGLTQVELAERIGMSRAALANVETGRQGVHVHQFVEVANALGIRSFETLLPANLWLPDNVANAPRVATTGSTLTSRQKRQVANIFDVLGD